MNWLNSIFKIFWTRFCLSFSVSLIFIYRLHKLVFVNRILVPHRLKLREIELFWSSYLQGYYYTDIKIKIIQRFVTHPQHRFMVFFVINRFKSWRIVSHYVFFSSFMRSAFFWLFLTPVSICKHLPYPHS